jgi:histidinol-phosphate/aromatic aminotransferase/cobyric acid decarboxylase-like protein/GNAT superfamily N-acetyltransferase
VRQARGSELEMIYRFRHEVYASELGQHPENPDQKLRDNLDGRNIYLVAAVGEEVFGFISITPPGAGTYSIDKYFARDQLPIRFDKQLYEIRLLTVLKEHRRTEIAFLLMYSAFRWVEAHGGTHVVAIGRREVLTLYRKAGLETLDFSVKSGEVTFDLLHAKVDRLRQKAKVFESLLLRLENRLDWQFRFSFRPAAACFHGGAFFKAIGESFQALQRKEEIISADVLDAWFAPSPKVTAVLESNLEWLLRTSPPTHCEGLIETISAVRGVPQSSLLAGGGSSALIFLAFRHWLTSASRALVLDPTYGEYPHVLEKVIGCTVDRFHLRRENEYELDLKRFQAQARNGYDLIVLVNPNSPTGGLIKNAELQELLRHIPSTTLVWVDETYIEYRLGEPSFEQTAVQSENVVVCKSMSKVYALSGARVAYLCAGAHLLEPLRAITPPWAVSLPAQVAAVNALQDPEYYQERYAQTRVLRDELASDLQQLGWKPRRGTANFLLCDIPANGPDAQVIVERCRERGLYLRNAAQMGTCLGDRSIRVAVKDSATNAKMLSIIQQSSGAGGSPMRAGKCLINTNYSRIAVPR